MSELEQEIVNYIKDYKANGEYSLPTLAAYESDLKGFAAFCEEEGRDGLPNATLLRSYLLKLELEGKSTATIARCLASFRGFARYLLKEGKAIRDISADLKAPEVVHKASEFLTPDEVVILLNAPSAVTRKGLRDRAMLELLYATGIRVSELLSLTRSDLNGKYRFLTVRDEKGGERVVPYGRYAEAALEAYFASCPDEGIPDRLQEDGLLFHGRSGRKLTRQGVHKILREYAQSAGISGEIGPQSLRDAYAKHMLDNGAGTAEVAGLLGVSQGMVMKYLNVSGERRITEVYKRTHPRA